MATLLQGLWFYPQPLFLVHLIGISSSLSLGTTASSFADDTRIQRGIEDEEDFDLLQQDLDRVYSWADEVGMMFNAGKFEVMRFWTSREAGKGLP